MGGGGLFQYESHVTLSIEADDTLVHALVHARGKRRERQKPFAFTPGKGLVEGWALGVLQMCDGGGHPCAATAPRATRGRRRKAGGAWHISGGSNLHFDIKILHRTGATAPALAPMKCSTRAARGWCW